MEKEQPTGRVIRDSAGDRDSIHQNEGMRLDAPYKDIGSVEDAPTSRVPSEFEGAEQPEGGKVGYKKVVIDDFGDADVVKVVEEESVPEPEPGEVRIKVQASSVVFTDMMIRRHVYPPLLREKPPLTLGYDLVGVVDELGAGVSGVEVGQRVADLTQTGGNAEYVCRPAEGLVAVPESLEAAEAVSVPLSYVTALQMLTRVANVQAGQRVLIHGATGAVGTALLQLGRLLELEMVGTASARNHDLIESYGAKAIDYRADDYEKQLRTVTRDGFDTVFEGAGSRLSRSLVRRGGTLVLYGFSGPLRVNQSSGLRFGIAAASGLLGIITWGLLPNGKSWKFYDISGTRNKHPEWFVEDAARLFGMLERNEIEPVISERFTIDEAARAHKKLDEGGNRGRMVLAMS